MKIVFNIILLAVSIGLIYLLIESIRKPIDFTNTRDHREEVVRAQLKDIAELQKLYKGLRQTFANDFDSLKLGLVSDTFYVEKMVGDPNDTTTQMITEEIKIPGKDSLLSWIREKGSDASIDEYFENIRKVPFSDGVLFMMATDSAIVDGTDSLMAPTFAVGTQIKSYMPEYPKEDFAIYDPNYNPDNVRRVGDLKKTTTSGNW
ncbi:MAG: hypothetical protein GY810_08305 [Aureispira sp.]|nr:hypothetical protein [Aureispira sp.]